MSQDNISLHAHDGRMTVTGEKHSKHGEIGKISSISERVKETFCPIFQVPNDAGVDQIQATRKDAVLTINTVKLDLKTTKPTKIKIARS